MSLVGPTRDKIDGRFGSDPPSLIMFALPPNVKALTSQVLAEGVLTESVIDMTDSGDGPGVLRVVVYLPQSKTFLETLTRAAHEHNFKILVVLIHAMPIGARISQALLYSESGKPGREVTGLSIKHRRRYGPSDETDLPTHVFEIRYRRVDLLPEDAFLDLLESMGLRDTEEMLSEMSREEQGGAGPAQTRPQDDVPGGRAVRDFLSGKSGSFENT